MKRAALGLVLVALAASPAFAGGSGGYVALGIGTTATTGGDLSNMDGGGLGGSLFVGQKLGMFGLEAGLTKFKFENATQSWDNIGIAAAGRFTLPIVPMVGAYLRVGIEKTWSDGSANSESADYTGTGWLAGIGAQYKLNLGFSEGAVWADYTRHDQSFVNDTRARDGNIDVISAGITVGF